MSEIVLKIVDAIDEVRAVRDDAYKAGHRVDEGWYEAILVLLRKGQNSLATW